MKIRKIICNVSLLLAIGFFCINNFISSLSIFGFCQMFFALLSIITHEFVYPKIKGIIEQHKELDKLDLELK